MKIYTTNLEVSQRIKELVGEMESTYHWSVPDIGNAETKEKEDVLKMCKIELVDSDYGDCFLKYPSFTLCQLPEVLKKVGEKLGWIEYKNAWSQWFHTYMKCCELHALGQNVDDYLMEMLK